MVSIIVLTTELYSQSYNSKGIDTINLEEIKIIDNIPLSDNDIVSFYKNSNFSTIDNVMDRIAGVTLIRRGSYAQEPQMHGFSAGQVNITIDGMRVFGACTDKMDPVTSYVEPDNLKSMRIKHGTNGSKMGSTVGGSINMELKESYFSSGQLVNAKIGTGYSTISNGNSLNADINLSKNNWAIRVSSVYRKHNDYLDGNGENVQFTQYEKVNLTHHCKIFGF